MPGATKETAAAGYSTLLLPALVMPSRQNVREQIHHVFDVKSTFCPGGRAMGIADRDYLRERDRDRRGLRTRKIKWNNRKSRVELDDDVSLGSASWIRKDPGKEFEMENPGYKARPTGTARWTLVRAGKAELRLPEP
jgi:hypothetical protein